jgi:alpha-methylacyl-CoA racemase
VFATPDSAHALDGVTVLDLTRYLPGPYCTRVLADLGATVIKVEPPGGDPMRTLMWYDFLNGGKREVTIDLRVDEGRRALDRLVGSADVFVEGFRPSTARALGVDAVTLRARYPQLVHCSISGYGQHGPDANRAGHDLNYQVESGLLGPDPRVPPMLVADITGALHAAIRILAALVERTRTGAGASLDVALLNAAAAWVPFVPPAILRGDHACYNVYESSDGRRMALGALEEKFWARFCEQVGRREWIPLQFAPEPRRSQLVDEVRAVMGSRSQSAWRQTFHGIDCCLTFVD